MYQNFSRTSSHLGNDSFLAIFDPVHQEGSRVGESFPKMRDSLHSQAYDTSQVEIPLVQDDLRLKDISDQDGEHSNDISGLVSCVSPVDNENASSQDINRAAYLKELNTCTPQNQSTSHFDFYQLGTIGHKSIVENGSISLKRNASLVYDTNSPLSNHITLIENLLRQKWQRSRGEVCGHTK
jgi:hypothetical protein